MITDNLITVQQHIKLACQAAERSAETVNLLAVSKRQSVASILTAYQAGQRQFGENYLNEALEKQAELSDYDIVWHYIGSIQSNKTRKMTEHFDWIHTVDSLKIAQRLSSQRSENRSPLNICLQINIDEEDSKSGLTPESDALIALATEINALPHINLRGLMCIPAPKTHQADELVSFTKMQSLFKQLNESGLAMDTLSMGMSADLEAAIRCGSTMVRVGTAIFGARE